MSIENYQSFFSKPLINIRDGIEEEFSRVVVGSKEPSKLDFPVVYVLPNESSYQGSYEYFLSCDLDFWREKTSNDPEVIDFTQKVEDAIDSVNSELIGNEDIHNWQLVNFRWIVGEEEKRSMVLEGIRVRYRIKSLIND